MADGLGENTGGGLPPKLDLRKSGVLKPVPEGAGQVSAQSQASEPVAGVKPTPVPTVVRPVGAPIAGVKPAPALTPRPVAAVTPKPVPTTVKPVGSPEVSDPAVSVADKSQTMRLVMPDDSSAAKATAVPGAVKPVSTLKPIQPLRPASAAVLTPKPAPASTTLAPKPVPASAPVGGSPASEDDALSQTMRLVVSETGEKPADMSEAKTIIQKPAVSAIKPISVIAAQGAKDPKRETSKIPLEAAKPSPLTAAAAEPKTIRISPAKPMSAKTAPVDMEDDKRKTSRISLEAALAPSDDTATPGAPKTIKIKKPSDSSTVKAVSGPSIKAAIDDLSKTARLDDASTDEEGGPLTRKKTIKVKRPTQRPGVQRTVQAPRPGTEASPAVGVSQSTGASGVVSAGPAPVLYSQSEEKMNPFFPICGIIAALILLVAIYMFCAQAFGPNVSLTELSYWPTGPDLPWPGKLQAYLLQK